MLNLFKRKKAKGISIAIICILFIVSYIGTITPFFEVLNKSNGKEDTVFKGEKGEQIPLASDYTLVAPINISSPSDWANYPFITGEGSDINPYVIENIEIQGNDIKPIEESGHYSLNYTDAGIYINAIGNFTIRNCKISSISLGIYLGFGASPDYLHSIQNVEIDNCGLGIYLWGSGGGGIITVNISKCIISNCRWVSIKAPYDLESPLHGGFGMWVIGDVGSCIEFCQIYNCSIGLFAGYAVSITSNQLFNCGFLFDISYIYMYNNIFNNTINEKPLGLFRGEDNLTISGEEASQYGQLIFAACHNLHLTNFHIHESCSFGLFIHYCNNLVLKNIECENQQIGFVILTNSMIADNLNVEYCNAGFCFLRIRNSILTQLSIENTDIPVYAYTPISNASIEIEKSVEFYIIDYLGVTEIQVNSSHSSIMIPCSNMSEFDVEGFIIQLDERDTYHVTGFDPHRTPVYDFIIIIIEPSKTLAILGFPLIWLFLAILTGILYSKVSRRYKKKIHKFSSKADLTFYF